MSWQSIRRVSLNERKANRLVTVWRERSIDLVRASPPATARLARVTAYGEDGFWTGYFDMDQWLSGVAPGLATLAGRGAATPTQIAKLFNTVEQPIPIPVSLRELSYARMLAEPCEAGEGVGTDYWSMHLEGNSLWIVDFPEGGLRARACASYENLSQTIPLRVDFRLGTSRVRRALLASVVRGDILLIQHSDAVITCQGARIATYRLTDEGMVMLEQIVEIAENGSTEMAQNVGSESTDEKQPVHFSALPVEVQFVLQRHTMTLRELDSLRRGEYLALDTSAEKNIALTVNGAIVAKGELVEVDGRLGVEVHTLFAG